MENLSKFGIDVSSYQGKINWNEVNVDFTIIRCGYGDNLISQDDKQFQNNISQCIKNNIPFGIYLYSYATKLKGTASIESEVAHTKRLLESIPQKPFCVYIDIEEEPNSNGDKNLLQNLAIDYCKQIQNLGYKAGVYSNEYFFKEYLNPQEIKNAGFSIWCAKYSKSNPNIGTDIDIWQYTNTGNIKGINGNIDLNTMYNDIINNKDNIKSIDILAQEVINGQWSNGEDRKNKLTKAGYDYQKVQSKVNELLKNTSSTITYKVKKGDTLSQIASKYNTTTQQIATYNNISNPNKIYIGQLIKIPPTNYTNSNYYTVKSGDRIFMGNNE